MSALAARLLKVLLDFIFGKIMRALVIRGERIKREREIREAREAHEQSGTKTPEEQEQAARDLINASRPK